MQGVKVPRTLYDAVTAEVACAGGTSVVWNVVGGARCVVAVAGLSGKVDHGKVVGSC